MSDKARRISTKNNWLRFINNKTTWIKCILILSIILSFYNVIIKEPMTYNDEETHFARSIEIANGDIKVVNDGDMSKVGGYISTSENEFSNTAHNVLSSSTDHVSASWISDYSNLEYSDDSVFVAVTNTIPNNPIVYFPYIVAAVISKWLYIKPVYEFLLMRLFGVFFFYMVYIFAIRLSSKGKVPLVIMSLSPTLFCTFSSISADAYLLSISALALTVIFELYNKIINKEELSWKFWVLVIVTSILIVCAKLPSFLFIVLFLPILYHLIKNKGFRTKAVYIITAIILLTALISIVWLLYVKDVNTGAFFGNNADTNGQLEYIWSHKKKFIGMMLHALASCGYWSLAFGYMNSKFPVVPDALCVLFYIGIYISSRYTDNVEKNNKRASKNHSIFNISVIIISVIYILLVFMMVYLQFCDVGSDKIVGVIQPRYFIPVYMMLMLMLSYNSPKKYSNKYVIIALSLLPTIAYLAFSFVGLNI